MEGPKKEFRRMKPILGMVFLSVGVMLLFLNLDLLQARVDSLAGRAASDHSSVLPAMAMLLLHGAQKLAFEHVNLVSFLGQTLLSFWPLLLIAAGIVILRSVSVRDALAGTMTPGTIASPAERQS